MSCSYTGCKNSRNTCSLSFFNIPNDRRREVWIKHSKATKFCKKSYFCEKHFYPKDIRVMGTFKCLKKNVIPIPCATVCNCKCTESIVDENCLKMMNSWTPEIRDRKSLNLTNIQNNSAPLLDMSTTKTEKVNNDQNQSKEEESKLKLNVLPHSFDPQQIDKIKIPHSTKQRTYLKRKIVCNFSETDPEPVSRNNERTSRNLNYGMNKIDQPLMARDDKKIECLEAVVNYTSQMRSIVKKKSEKNCIIKANSHLIELLDKVIYEWYYRAQRRVDVGVITDQSLIQVALESKQIFRIQNFNPDQEWLDKLKIKYNITDLGMRMLYVENNRFPSTVNVHDIVLYVLEKNPIEQYFSNISLKDDTILENENNTEIETHIRTENDLETIVKTDEINMEEQTLISNDTQARLYLKPLEEFVLLKDNFRAIELISQLIEVFSAEIQK